MLTTTLVAAGVSVFGFWLIYQKLPKKLKQIIRKYSLATDFIAAILTYILFAGTVSGLIIAAWVGVMVSLMLAIVNNPASEALLERFVLWASRMKSDINSWMEGSSVQRTPLKLVKEDKC